MIFQKDEHVFDLLIGAVLLHDDDHEKSSFFKQTKKQRRKPLLCPAWGGFLLSPNGPPSCWRTKRIIEVKANLFLRAEHAIILPVVRGGNGVVDDRIIAGMTIWCQGFSSRASDFRRNQIGHPVAVLGKGWKKRKPVGNFAHRERWGQPFA